MKLLSPAPSVPGSTDAERFDNAVRAIFSVSKVAVLKKGTYILDFLFVSR